MAEVLRKVQAGDRLQIPAVTWNTLLDVAQERQARSQNQTGESQPRGLAAGIVLVKNASGADRERFDVLGIDGPIFTPTDSEQAFTDRVALKGVTPTEDDHMGRFVILAEPVKAGLVARAWAFGVCPVKIQVDDEAHRFADVTDGAAGHLAGGSTGAAMILWKESGTGEKWALVRFDCAPGTVEDPAVLEPQDFEQETAATDEWDITDPPAGKGGVTVRVQTRTAYNDAGDQKLYAFHRNLTFDSRGCLVAAKAETRVEIDAPEDC
jgi:hypothetical protein